MDLSGLRNGFRVSPQLLGRRGSRLVVDASRIPTKIDPASGLTLFPIAGVFTAPGTVFLGFGKPNTYLVIPRTASSTKGEGWDKFAAFMFWRKASFIADTKGRVQAGVLFELVGLDNTTIATLRQEMQNHSNRRGASCAHTNAQVLDAAGFTCGGKRLTHVYRPSKLASLIWRHGLELDGEPVQIRIVQTGDEVSDHFVSVWRRELTSLCRTVQKKFQKQSDDHAPAPLFEMPLELVQPQPRPKGQEVKVGISRPSELGAHLGFIFGQHPIFVCDPEVPMNLPELATPLKPFPGKLDRVTKLKKYILFSPLAVRFIRRHLMTSIDYYPGISASTVVDMIRPSQSADGAQAFKYNIVMTGEQIFLTRLENGNGRDWRKINWILAKHVLISGYNPDVRFSGEIWMHVDRDGTPTIYMTADSGTYRPDEARLEPAAQYTASTFNANVMTVRTR